MQLTGAVVAEFNALAPSEQPREILVDSIGLGAGVVDRLRELGLPARGINVSESPAMGGTYRNLKAELWYKSKAWLEARDCKLPKDEVLIAAKHQSFLDIIIIYASVPRGKFIMKKELAPLPFFGWFAVKTKMIAVDRSAHSKALKDMVRQARLRFAEGRQMLIFPEGTRAPVGAAPDYKPGIAALYRELEMPVVPLALNTGCHWPAHGFMRYPGTIVFEFLPPIPAGLKRGEFMRELESRLETASNALIAEGAREASGRAA
jgi:1-acyl-sn-glycerol-3-phosphate acyltransferase